MVKSLDFFSFQDRAEKCLAQIHYRYSELHGHSKELLQEELQVDVAQRNGAEHDGGY